MHLRSTKTTTGSASVHTLNFATRNIYRITSFHLEYVAAVRCLVHTIFGRNRVQDKQETDTAMYFTRKLFLVAKSGVCGKLFVVHFSLLINYDVGE